jgi:hypothetical protein
MKPKAPMQSNKSKLFDNTSVLGMGENWKMKGGKIHPEPQDSYFDGVEEERYNSAVTIKEIKLS